MRTKLIIVIVILVLALSCNVWARGKPTPVKSDDSTTVTLKPGQSMRFDALTGVSISVGGDGTGVSVYITSTASGGSAPGGGTAGGFQFNDGGVLNGIAELRAIKNASGVTTVFGMSTAGATVWALNWQGYAAVGYYPGGTTEYLKDTTGVTQYDAAGNVLWSTISGFYISGIEAPSANITMKTAVFDTTRSGVSPSSDRQITTMNANNTGVSILASQYGTIIRHAWTGASVYGLHPIGGATEYVRFEDITGTGITIYAANQEPFQGTAGSATSAICIPPLYPRHYVTLFAVASGGTKYWSFEGSSAVSRWN